MINSGNYIYDYAHSFSWEDFESNALTSYYDNSIFGYIFWYMAATFWIQCAILVIIVGHMCRYTKGTFGSTCWPHFRYLTSATIMPAQGTPAGAYILIYINILYTGIIFLRNLLTELNCESHYLRWTFFWQISYCEDTLLRNVPNSCWNQTPQLDLKHCVL